MPNDLSIDEFDALLSTESRKRLPTIDDLKRAAAAKGINPEFAAALVSQESGGNWNTKPSPAGARGGMQVMPGTFRAMMGDQGNQDDPWDNMEAGLRYIDYGRRKLGTDDPVLLAAGYHQGYDRPELRAGKIADTNDGLISTRDYARAVAAKAGIRLDNEPDKNPSQRMLESWEAEGLKISGALDSDTPVPKGAPAGPGAPKASGAEDKGFVGRNAGYLKDNLKISWNSLANWYDGWMASQYGELLNATEGAPLQDRIGTQAEYDRYMASIAKRQKENEEIQKRGRPETQQFFQASEGKGFLEQASMLGDALMKNPVGVITDIGTQSLLPSLAIAATALAARFGFGGTTPAVAAGGAGSMGIEFGNDYADLRLKGESHEKAWQQASIKAGVVGLLDAASMASAGKALDKVLESGLKGRLKEVGKEVGKQAALGAAGEGLGTLASGRTPDLASVTAEAIGEVFSAPGEAISTFRGRPQQQGLPPAASTAPDMPAVPGQSALPQAAGISQPAAQPGAVPEMAVKTVAGRPTQTPEALPEASALLRQEMDAAVAAQMSPTLGGLTTFQTESGANLEAQYALVDADALLSSHDEFLRPNPAYPAEIQPRDRERAASEVQISSIVQRLNPARLGESQDAANGAPIVGDDGVVESGNARTIALKRVYQSNGQTAQQYRQWLENNAQRFGLAPNDVAAMAKPVLVRVRRTPVDRAEFARQANAPTTATMSPTEQAKSDAARITTFDDLVPNESGEFATAANQPFMRRFLAALPQTEQAALIDGNGELNQAGYVRVRNAILARAYGGSPVLLRMVESMDNNLRNVSSALLRAAPRVAKAREAIAAGAMFDADLTDSLISAVEELSRLRSEGQSVANFLGQAGVFGPKLTPEATEILQFLDENIRRPRQIADLIGAYLDVLAEAGNPAQTTMFEEARAPERLDVLRRARERIREQDSEGVRAGPGDRAAPQPGGTGGGGGASQAQGAGNNRPDAEAGGQRGGPPRTADGPGPGQGQVTPQTPPQGGVSVSRPPAADGLTLTSPTKESLAEDEKRRQREEAERAKQEQEAADRQRADQERNNFTLAGSDRPADVAMGGGQQNLLAAGPAPAPNTIFTEDAAAAARERLRKKLGRPNIGLDPEALVDGITLAGYHIEKGARKFAAYAKAMVDDMGDVVKPYLVSWYLAVRNDPRAASLKADMDRAADVEDLDINQVLAEASADPVKERIPLPDNMEYHLFTTSDGWGIGQYDVDAGQYVDESVLRFTGEDAETKARERMRRKADQILRASKPKTTTGSRLDLGADPVETLMGRMRRYASGLSAIGDLSSGGRAAGGAKLRGVGVDVGELSANGIETLANAIVNQQAAAFVDSGAFGAFRRGLKSGTVTPMDFDAILAKYDRILEAISDANPAEMRAGDDYPMPLMVMPDIVGDQAGSIELARKYKAWIATEAMARLMRPIVPIQIGDLTMAEAYAQVVEILGTDNFIVGIPSNEKAVSNAEFTQFLRDARPKAVHILGAASDRKLAPRLRSIIEAGMADTLEVTADASPIRSAIMRAVQQGAKRGQAIEDFLAEPDDRPSPGSGAASVNTPEGRAVVAQAMADRFIGGDGFATIVEARKYIADMTGEKVEPGTQAAKFADETVELAVVLAGREMVRAGRAQGRSDAVIYDRLVSLYGLQPTLGVRTSTSVREQAYSTPVPLAFLASRLAMVTPDTTVGEPTAGNTMLLIEAEPGKATVNELNADRAANARAIGFEVSSNDAARRALAPAKTLDRIVANPPFGAVKDNKGETVIFPVAPDYQTREVDHAIAFKALEALKDDGAAVLILGGVDASSEDAIRDGYRSKSKREFYFRLYNEYGVVDHFTVDGGLYSKQGAGYPVDVVVIRGRGKTSRALPAADLPTRYGSWDSLKEKLDGRTETASGGMAPGRPAAGTGGGDGAAGQPPGGGAVVGGPGGAGAGSGGQGAGPGGGGAVGGANTGAAGAAGQPGRGGGAGAAQPGAQNVDVGAGAVPGEEPVPGQGPRGQGTGATGDRGNRPGAVGRVGGQPSERGGSGLTDRRGQEQETETQVAYAPQSGAASVGTLVPRAMRDSIAASLKRVADRVGNIDAFVAEQLNFTPAALSANFSAEQIDALALAIVNAEAGKGFIIGDQTGIGKGRVVAAMLRYAMVKGKVPIFVTEKPNLYADMIRDLDDIGMGDELQLQSARPLILMTNSGDPVPYVLQRTANGEVVESEHTLRSPGAGAALERLFDQITESGDIGPYRVVFTTYSQLQTVKGKATARMRMVRRLAEGGYVVFDESHNAGGTQITQARTKGDRDAVKAGETTTGRSGFVRSLVRASAGSFFSSATYAKRPDVMDLYSSTNMLLAVDKPSDLAPAIMDGGVPMQQIVATMLAQDGQYIRRERTFAGVGYETRPMPVDRKTAENMAQSMRMILAFSREKDAAIKAMQKSFDREGAMLTAVGGEKTTVQGANFGAIMHNLIDQMLLALKAQQSIDFAIERLRAGEKVVLTVANTMGSFLSDYANEFGVRPGDPVSLSFADLYQRYLEKQRIVKIKRPGAKEGEPYRLTDGDLGPDLVAQFAEVSRFIRGAGFGAAPISPIDYMHQRLREAGYKTDEITGRSVTVNYGGSTPTLASRNANIKQRLKAIRGFNSGEVDVIILNQSGSTGLSLHASSKVKDQRKRRMIIVQAEKNIDTHMQMLGRVHRTGQVITPDYTQAMADIPAEARPASVLMKKMASLNANTTANRKSAVTAEGVVDFMNDYGGQVAAEFLLDNPEIHMDLGGNKVLELPAEIEQAGEELIRKLTGYIPILPIEQQEAVYKDLMDRYAELITREDAMGTNKLEAKALDLGAKTLKREQITAQRETPTPSLFASPAFMEQVDVARTVKPMSKAEVRAAVEQALAGRSGAEVAAEMRRDLNTKARAYADAVQQKRVADGADTDTDKRARMAAEIEAIAARKNVLADLLDRYRIGQAVSLLDTNQTVTYGVITDVVATGKTKSPVAGSGYKFTIALANGEARSLTLSASQIDKKFTIRPENGPVMTLNPATNEIGPIEVSDLFDAYGGSGNIRREKRWMVTGNLLAGFASYPGQIITYTTDDGSTGQGVLMRRGFDFEKQRAQMKSSFPSPALVRQFFERAGAGAVVETPDGTLRVRWGGDNADYPGEFLVSSSKREGGRFFLDRGFTDAIGRDFTKVGQVMRARVSEANMMRGLGYLMTERDDVKLEAQTHKDVARDVLGLGTGATPSSGGVVREPVGVYSSSAQAGANVAREPDAPYEQDLFGNPVPAPRRAGAGARPAPAAAAGRPDNLDAPAPIQLVTVDDALPGVYRVTTAVVEERRESLPVDRVTTPEDAARAFGYLGRNAVERLDGLVTDAKGKPLALVGGFKGAIAQAPVHPDTMLQEAFRIKGAANLWIGHNHPSGVSDLSRADVNVGKKLFELLDGSGITMRGMLAVGANGSDVRFSFIGYKKDFDPVDPNSRITEQRIFVGPDVVTAPLVNRVITNNDWLENGAIESPTHLQRFVTRVATDKPALLLLTNQHVPTAVVELDQIQSPLRQGGRMDALYRSLSMANAGTAVIINPNGSMTERHIENVGNFLASAGLRVLDVISYQYSQRTKAHTTFNTYSMQGRDVVTGGGFFSRGTQTRGMPAAQVQSTVDALRRRWTRAPEIVVVRNMSDPAVPEDVRRENLRQLSVGADGVPHGFFYGGKVYLVAEGLGSRTDVAQTVFHEVLGHFGLRGAFGDSLNQILWQVGVARPELLRRKAKKYGFALTLKDAIAAVHADRAAAYQPRLTGAALESAAQAWLQAGRSAAAEEVLAEIAQTRPDLGLVRRAVAAIRTWLRENIPGFRDLKLTDDEIIRNYILPARAWVERSQEAARPGARMFFQRARDRSMAGRGFYSALMRGIETLPANAAPAAGWMDAIKGLVNKGAAKADEVEWSGVRDWLSLQTGKVSKEAVIGYLEQGGVRVEETMLGGRLMGKAADDALYDWVGRHGNRESPQYNPAWQEFYDSVMAGDTSEETLAIARRLGVTGTPMELVQGAYDGFLPDGPRPKHGQYTLPGGKNYREVLLTLPSKAVMQQRWTAYGSDGYSNGVYDSEAEAREAAGPDGDVERAHSVKVNGSADYRSNHWTQPNVLAHIRMNDRVDADGKRVLFIEEIQSDWGQEGREKGFTGGVEPTITAQRVGPWVPSDPNGDGKYRVYVDGVDAGFIRAESVENAIQIQRGALHNRAFVPRAPFVTKTEGWLNLALKRVMTMAAEGGYDRVAFVNGEQSAERYDLSKRISRISYNKLSSGTVAILAVDLDNRRVLDKDIPATELEDFLGKEIAQKIVDDPNRRGTLSGLDLKVGGEGMKAFYDKIVPNAVNALLKKVGGEKIGEVGIQVPPASALDPARTSLRETSQQPGFDITPAMRETVAAGLPLFQRVFHGTPHRGITQFSTDNVGTGEGSQAFGWGLYFASKREIADYYRATLSSDSAISVAGNTVRQRDYKAGSPKHNAVTAYVYDLNAGKTADEALNGHLGYLEQIASMKGKDAHWQRVEKDVRAYVAVMERWHADGVAKHVGQLYEVEIPEDGEMLDWDKPLSEQPEVVREALQGIGGATSLEEVLAGKDIPALLKWVNSIDPNNSFSQMLDEYPDATADDLRSEIIESYDDEDMSEYLASNNFSAGRTGQSIYLELSAKWGDDRAASKALRAAGIKGIRYLDGNSRKKGEGSHNYVIFDGADTQIAGVMFSRGRPPAAPPGPSPQQPLPNVPQAPQQAGLGASGGAAPPAGPPVARTWGPQAPLPLPAWTVDEPSRLDNILYSLQNKLVDTKRVIEAIKEWGAKVSDWIDPYLHEELYHGRVAKRTQEFLQDELKPLLAQMRLNGVTIPDFEEFLHNRHAEERNDQIARINPNMPDAGSGIATADARAYLAGLDPKKRQVFDRLAQKIDAITAETRQILIAYGLESPSTIAAWDAAYKNYVPLQREDMETGFSGNGTGSGFSVRGPSSRRATGSLRNVVDILGNLALQRERAIVRGEKNRVATALWGLAKSAPNPDFWKVDKPPMIKTVNPATGLVDQFADPNFKSRDNVIVARIPDPRTGEVHERAVIFNERSERALRMARALKNLDADQLGWLLGKTRAVTRYFASINTQFNPIFGIVNFLRDVQGAAFNLSSTPLAGRQRQVAAGVVPALRGIYADQRAARAGAKIAGPWSTLWEEFQKEGGQTGYRDMWATGEERAKALEDELRALGQGRAMRGSKAILGWLSDYNQAIENSVRLATYKAGLDAGLTKQRAASLAKNITVNFNRKGQMATQAGALYAFFNAGVQGTTRMVETLRGPAGRKIIGGGLLLGSMQALALALAGYDDDEPPQFVRERNLIMPLPGQQYVSIPMPLGLHVLPNTGRMATEFFLSGMKDPSKRVVDWLAMMAESFNPLGNAGLSMQTLTPTPLDPVAALAENKDWTGKPIYREDINKREPTPGFTRNRDTATSWSRGLAYALNFMSGGTDFKPGAVSPTADAIDFLIGQATGGIGREVSKVAQMGETLATGEQLPSYKIPLVGRLYGTTDGQSSQANRFYGHVQRLAEHEAEIKGRAQTGGDFRAYIAENPEARLWAQANQAERAVSQLRRRKREAIDAGRPKEEIRRLDEAITERMKRLNEAVSAERAR